jgi:molybdenum cofactor cytidylyltransferase
MITGLVLAAGESKRMGQPKMLLPFQGKTVIESVLEEALLSRLDKVLVILGSDREVIQEKIQSLPAETCFNPGYKKGMLSSVHAGLKNLKAGTNAVCLLLGDQPHIRAAVIDHLIEAFDKSKQRIVIPVYSGRRGHPVIFSADYTREIFTLNPDIGLRELMRRHADDILEVEMKEAGVLDDMDTPEDYERLRKKQK